MFSKIKIALGIAVTAVIAFLTLLLNIRTNQRDKAVAKQEKAETQRDVAIEANETHQKVNEVKHEVQEAVNDVRNTPIDDRRARMRKRAEDYHGSSD